MADVMYRMFSYPCFNDPCFYEEYPILKHTPCGVWVDHWGKRKFINTQCRKQFAYATKEEAHKGYIKRTERYIKLLKARSERAQQELDTVIGIKPQPVPLLEFKEVFDGC